MDLAGLVRDQASACARMGSALYAQLLAAVAEDVESRGPSLTLLSEQDADPFGGGAVLRLLGTVHHMVLAGEAPQLAPFYPSTGGHWHADAAWPAFRALLDERADAIRAGMRLPPQTNEVGRSVPLLGGLLHVMAATGLPLRLLEMGASGGLNLRVDRFRFELAGGVAIGPGGSPVVFEQPWLAGDWPPLRRRVDIVDRAGCDTDPIDPLTEAGQLRLTAYVWPDQTERLARLRGAFAAARMAPGRVVASTARDFLANLAPEAGVATVVWHSVMWQYLDAPEQTALDTLVRSAGDAASEAAPVARVSFEPRRLPDDGPQRFVLAVTRWPGGQEHILGYAHPHGVPTRWFGAAVPADLPTL